jgi:hypothetical protein
MYQDVFENLVAEMEAHVDSVTLPPQHMENFSRPLEIKISLRARDQVSMETAASP